MGFFKNMFDKVFNKNGFNKLTREEVVNSIVELNKQESDMEKEILEIDDQVSKLMEKGRTEKSHDMRILYAKKINFLKEEKESKIQRIMFIMYNVSLLNKLKNAVDEKEFFMNNQSQSLNQLLSDQKALAQFLNGALNTRVRAEDVMTSADQTFADIKNLYEKNDTIYGVGEKEDNLLAMFEEESGVMDGAMGNVSFDSEPEKQTDQN